MSELCHGSPAMCSVFMRLLSLPAPCRCSRRGRPRRRATSVRTQAGTTRNGTSPTSTWRCAPHECMNASTVGAQRPNVADAPCLGRLGCSVGGWSSLLTASQEAGAPCIGRPHTQAASYVANHPPLPHPTSNPGATGADVARPGCGHPPMPSAWLLCPDAASNQPGKNAARLGCSSAFDPSIPSACL